VFDNLRYGLIQLSGVFTIGDACCIQSLTYVNFTYMKSNNVFLFYYSLVATTILLLASFFILPRPQNIANTILLAPVVFFLWTHTLNPDFFSAPKWSPKLGALSIVFCLLGIFSYFLFTKFSNYLPSKSLTSTDSTLQELKQSLTQSNSKDVEFRNQLEKEIGILSTKIDSLGVQDLNTLGVTTPAESPVPLTALGQITAKDANLTNIAIYESESEDSKVVGSAKYGITYPFYEKNDSWYKIAQGWVEARWFTEVNP